MLTEISFLGSETLCPHTLQREGFLGVRPSALILTETRFLGSETLCPHTYRDKVSWERVSWVENKDFPASGGYQHLG